MAPVRQDAPFGATSPIFSYPYERSREALEKLERDAPVDDWDGVKLRYIHPLTGGSPMPTMATFMLLVVAAHAIDAVHGEAFGAAENRYGHGGRRGEYVTHESLSSRWRASACCTGRSE